MWSDFDAPPILKMFKFNVFSVFVAHLNIANTLRLRMPEPATVQQVKWKIYIFPRTPSFQVFSLCCRLLILDIIRIFKIERYCYIILLRNGLIKNTKICILYLKNRICESSKKFSVSFSIFIGFKILKSKFRSFWKYHDGLKLNCEKVW